MQDLTLKYECILLVKLICSIMFLGYLFILICMEI
jgi:hypothetical protein